MRRFAKTVFLTTFLASPAVAQISGGSSTFDDIFGDAAFDAPAPQAAPVEIKVEQQDPILLLDPQVGVAPTIEAEKVITAPKVVDPFNEIGNDRPASVDIKPMAEMLHSIPVQVDMPRSNLSVETAGGSFDVNGGYSLERMDALNREKVLLEQQNAIEELRLKSLKNELDRMLMIETANKKLAELKGAQTEKVTEVSPGMVPSRDEGIVAEDPVVTFAPPPTLPPMPELPVVSEVVGANGEIVAQGERADGSRITMKEGTILPSGLVVEEVTASGVHFFWPATGQRDFAGLGTRPAIQPLAVGPASVPPTAAPLRGAIPVSVVQ